MVTAERHVVQRQRHELKRRELTVAHVERVTPRLVQIELTGESLADFTSLAPDDHCKLILGDGAMRDVTPRSFNRDRRTLTLQIALHPAGPLAEWARAVQPGDAVTVGGPKGSMVVPDDFDWYLLVGDHCALPALARRLAELRSDVPVHSVFAVPSAEDVPPIETRTRWEPTWVFGDASAADQTAEVLQHLERMPLPNGDGLIWIAGETGMARTLYRYVTAERGHPAAWTKASGYWRRGEPGAHENIG
jgi:NADPH-dependent ferric siderophore reductase